MGELTEESDSFRETLTSLAQEHWDKNQAPLLLAQVPSRLKLAGFYYDKNELHPGESLRSFIERTISDSVRVVSDTKNPVIVGVVPSSVPEESIAPHSWLKREASQEGDAPQRFLRPIFSAFSKPLTKERRAIGIAQGKFFELDDSDPNPNGSIPVPTSLIRKEGEEVSDRDLAGRVKRWADDNDIPIASLLDVKKNDRFRSLGRNETLLLGTLSPADMQRIMIPLDIVLKLLRAN